MRLHRFALLHFKPRPAEWDAWSTPVISEHGRVDVSTLRIRVQSNGNEANSAPQSKGLLVDAVTELKKLPPLGDHGQIVVSPARRIMCEDAIEHVSNIISVLEGCARSVVSPIPCLALEHVTESEREFLESSAGIQSTPAVSESGARSPIARSEELLQAMSDRMNGVALLSEAYSGGGESSKYREFIRFFELAFRMSSSQVARKLTQFLSQAPMGYTRQEINNWLNLRHPHSHADFRQSEFLAVTSDIRVFIMRMEQACLDILFNKSDWMNKSRTRRDIWMPEAITTSATGNLVVRQGATLKLLFRTYDEFGVYPRDLGAMIGGLQSSLYSTFATVYEKSTK